MADFISPVPSSLDVGGFPPPVGFPLSTPALIVQGLMPDHFTADIPATALYDATVNPLIISPLLPGAIFFVTNREAVPVLVKSANPADPGFAVPAGTTVMLSFQSSAAGNFLLPIGGGFPPGVTGSGTLAVATTAALPAPASVPNDTLVFVQSQRSWYRSDLALNAFFRETFADPSWLTQVAWGLDTVAGSDNNVGTVASPLLTFGEFTKRLPQIALNTTLTIAAGSALTANDWMEYSPQAISGLQAAIPSLTISGVRTLGANNVIITATNEAGNTVPLLDIGIALVPGNSIVQATSGAQSGATTAVLANAGGTLYIVAPWRSAAGARVVPPAPGDTAAVVTLPTVPRVALSSVSMSMTITDLSIAQFDRVVCRSVVLNTCKITGSLILIGYDQLAFNGCNFSIAAGLQWQSTKCTINLSAILGAPSTMLVEQGANLILTNNVVQPGGAFDFVAQNGGYLEINSLGCQGCGIVAVRGGGVRIRGTLYGLAGAVGVDVNGGQVFIDTGITPTLASGGVEVRLDGAATAIPKLVAGLVVPAASALTTWANWTAAPFSREVMSYISGGTISSV